ncbi:response regulator transcription factor [Mucilaginibacter sp. KACC 22063]|uniref:response regulator transcription factor n=1 Tax=Mucilaginibacter sp. KACC 22063 TaxID=3025666 RepID=UPI002366B287|nr:response regulator transcription factor [Mucilaginibacter sp. KACC 22063]WDF54688.1 response regulator transcription factor [Mucilaginibacter sp. KACC 22063]
MKILIVEDEADLMSAMKDYLTSEGNVCETAATFDSAYQKISIYDYDCILLDLMLPDGNGFQLLKHLKSLDKSDGVVIISARNALDDRITGFNMGADDYLIKPFHLSELNARIAAVTRRKNNQHSTIVTFNEIKIDLLAKTVNVNNHELHFTRKEYDLLLYFIYNKGKAISKSAAAEHLWGDDADMADSFDFIYTHIKNIRKKLADAGAKDYFHSVYGLGYRFSES